MVKAKFCPNCGKEIKEGIFCTDCNPEYGMDYKPIDFRYCPECGDFFRKNKWVQFDLNEIVRLELKDHLIIKSDKEVKYNIVAIHRAKEAMTIKGQRDIIIVVEIDGQDYELDARILKERCTKCNKKGTKYFEGILQFRFSIKAYTVDEIKPIYQEVQDIIDSLSRRGVFCNNIETIKNGYDFYITDKSFLKKIAQRLIDKYGGYFTESPQLFSHNHQTGKDLYRINCLFHLPDFKLGDIVVCQGKYYFINSLASKISAIILNDYSKVKLDYSFFKDKTYEVKKNGESQIVQLNPSVIVLDPIDYTDKNLKFSEEYFKKENHTEGNIIKVFKDDNEVVYHIPKLQK